MGTGSHQSFGTSTVTSSSVLIPYLREHVPCSRKSLLCVHIGRVGVRVWGTCWELDKERVICGDGRDAGISRSDGGDSARGIAGM